MALPIAKLILKTQFDFVVTESFASPYALNVFEKVLQNKLKHTETRHQDNTGIHSNSIITNHQGNIMKKKNNSVLVTKIENLSWRRRLDDTSGKGSYRADIPSAVLKFLERDNAADIDLYAFALELLERRKLDEW